MIYIAGPNLGGARIESGFAFISFEKKVTDIHQLLRLPNIQGLPSRHLENS